MQCGHPYSRVRALGTCGLLGWLTLGCGGNITGPAAAGGAGGEAGRVVTGGTLATDAHGMSGAGHAGSTGRGASGMGGAGQGGRGALQATGGAGGTSGTGNRPGDGTLANPAPGSRFFIGVNFWNIDWEGSGNYFSSGVDWSTTQDPWNRQFLQDLAPYHVLRFMDWNLINESDNPQASWATRKRMQDEQDEPVAFEWQIDLCNRTAKDYWINIPHAASADYVMQLATLIHDRLDSSLRVYVEWSNEVWNGAFPQRSYAQQQGEQLGLAGQDKAAAYQVYQSVRAFETFEAVFGAGSPRVVKVLAGQAAWTGPCEAQLAALEDPQINPKGTRPSVYAVAPYFAGSSLDELSNNGIPEATGWVKDSETCARGAGLPLIAYEGGQDSYAAGERGCANIQREAGMHDVYLQFLDAMQGAKLTGPLMQYTHSGNCWGLKQKTSDSNADSPKYQGLLDWLSNQP